jgi:hypothetical protein
MSEEKEKEEVDRAVSFYEALSGYFRTRPIETVIFLHDAVDGLTDTIRSKEDLMRDLGYFIGRLQVLTRVIWIQDHLRIVQNMVADPDTHDDIIKAIMNTAKAYYLLHSGEPIAIADVAHLIDNATLSLFRIITTIIDKANEAS